ncbi:ABC transporter ATP-binding protein [Oceaniglobus ichthyenteri]|uniref:ABC transporter ATP-binding protein n=1 Tax=Oceaniglobus ichthyenteri TaxID=2136177 RepID=UPI003B8373C8
MLTLTNITKSWGQGDARQQVLRGIDFKLAAGQSCALTGESGSGKSTLLHLAAGLDDAESGTIILDGQDVTALNDAGRAALRRTTVGVIFQQFNLIPSLNVAANIAFQARLANRADPAWADALARRLGLSEHLRKYPEQLSGGQQQRVAIGRTLAARPKLILADEPTGNLDEDTGTRVLDLMLELVRETGTTLLMVTHSGRLADLLDRRAHLERGRITP